MSQTGAGAGEGRQAAGRELALRFVSAAALAVIALAGALLGGWPATAVIAVVMVIVHLEWTNITEHAVWPAAALTAGLALALVLYAADFRTEGFVVAAAAILAGALSADFWRPLGLVYAAFLGFGLLALRLSPATGLMSILVLLAVVWATDTGAFFVGRGIGGAKLWPRVSPNKTWAGAIGGLVAGVVAGLIVAALLHVQLSAPLAAITVVLALSAEAGDLFESHVKRQFGAKDSGRLVPGHGGLMDRVDGLAVAAGLAALIGWLHGGGNVGQGLLVW